QAANNDPQRALTVLNRGPHHYEYDKAPINLY
ncbi:MAG: hypothetical protein ACI9MF_002153, partial [Gammaproteobacteria bacterium]